MAHKPAKSNFFADVSHEASIGWIDFTPRREKERTKKATAQMGRLI